MPGGEPGSRIGRVAVVLSICVVSAVAAPAAWGAQGTTVRVSVAAGGGDTASNSNWPSASADGRYVTFSSWADNLVPNDTNDNSDIFVRDLVTGTTRLVSAASDGTQVPISLVYREGARSRGSAPLLLTGYGAYGFSVSPGFNSARVSLRSALAALRSLAPAGPDARQLLPLGPATGRPAGHPNELRGGAADLPGGAALSAGHRR